MWSGQWHDLKMASRAKYEQWRAARPLSRRSTTAVALATKAAAGKVAKVYDAVRRCRDDDDLLIAS